jgi:hypothetical protein
MLRKLAVSEVEEIHYSMIEKIIYKPYRKLY